MTKNTVYHPHLNVNAPFGYKHEGNGLDFSRSIHNPDSNLVKVVQYVRSCETPVSRRNILAQVFGIRGARVSGWGTLLFSGMIKAGFLEKYGRGNAVRYGEGRRATLIKGSYQPLYTREK